MKIAVLGGAGYLGCIIVKELDSIGHEVVAYDNYMFYGDIKGSNNCLKVDVLKEEIDFSTCDMVVWSIDIDCENFYTNEISKKYIEINLSVFNKLAKSLGSKLIFITDMYEGNNVAYGKFLENKLNIAVENKCIIYKIPHLFGPSPSMRFDTMMNGMFLSAHMNGAVFINDWLKKHSFCSVAVAGRQIATDIISNSNGKPHDDTVVNCRMSLIECAGIINKVFGNKITMGLSDDCSIYEDTEQEKAIKLKKFGDFTIVKCFEYMIKAIEKGMVTDIEKDLYSNSQIIENFISSERFFEFKNELYR